MSTRKFWHKAYHADYLSLPETTRLSWIAKGVLETAESALWWVTDVKGKFIVNGIQLAEEEIVDLIASFRSPLPTWTGHKVRQKQSRKQVADGLKECIEAGVIRHLPDGGICAPSIIEEEEQSERNRRNGSSRWAKSTAAQQVAMPRAEQEQSRSEHSEAEPKAAPALRVVRDKKGATMSKGEEERIVRACENKSPQQIANAVHHLLEKFATGDVQSPVGFAAKIISEEPEVGPDRAASNRLQQARHLCNELGVPLDTYESKALMLVARHPGGWSPHVSATWDAFRSGSIPDEPEAMWAEFVRRFDSTQTDTAQ